MISLDNKEIYYSSDTNYSICDYSSYGPTFGSGHDFYISSGCKNNNNSYISSPNS